MRWWRAALLGSALAGCAVSASPSPHVRIGALRHGLDPFLAAHPLRPGEAIRADLVERTAGASVHVVQVHGSERPHRHVDHDLVVVVLRGEGVLTLGGEEIPMQAGDTVLVARGAPHWFAAEPGTTAVALVTFAPPLDAPDSVPIADVDSAGERR